MINGKQYALDSILCIILGRSIIYTQEIITIDLLGGSKKVPLFVQDKNYYEILNLDSNATFKDIILSFAKAKIKNIQNKSSGPYQFYHATAFDVLANSNNRALYDQKLSLHRENFKKLKSVEIIE